MFKVSQPIPYDRAWVGPATPAIKPYYLSFEDTAIQPSPLVGWTPTRTVPFTTKAGLDSALSGLTDGDLVKYTGTGVLTISSSSNNGYTFSTPNVATKAVFDFGNYYDPNHVLFQSTSTSSFLGAWFISPTNCHFLGGEFQSLKSSGVRWDGGSNSSLIGAVMHNCGAGGLYCGPSSSHLTVSNCRFQWESFGNNQNPAGDPHGDSGGGYHDGLISDTNQTNGLMQNNVFICYGHDDNVGSCVQFGDSTGTNINLNNNIFFVKAVNNTYVATVSPWDIAMGFVVWGSATLSGNVAELLEVYLYEGRATFCDSLTSSSPNGMTIKHGRARKTNQDPTFLASHDGTLSSTAAWDTRQPTKLIHQDVVDLTTW